MVFIDKTKVMFVNKNSIYPLTEEDCKNIFCDIPYRKDFIKIGCKIYHKKDRLECLLLNELVGENVSEYFNLQTVKSIIAMNDGEDNISELNEASYVLLTELFTDKYCQYDTSDIFTEFRYYDDVGLDNLDRLQTIYPLDVKKDVVVDENDRLALIKDFKKVIIRDFMTEQTDRTPPNIILQYKGNNIKLMPIFDYEYSFGDYYGDYAKYFFHIFDFDLRLPKVVQYSRKDEYIQELLHLAMSLDMSKRLQMLQEEYKIRLDAVEMEKYDIIIKQKKCLIKEYRLLK